MKQISDTLTTIGIAATGSTATQLVNHIDPSTIQTALNILLQVAIGIVTLWSLFAKKKAQ